MYKSCQTIMHYLLNCPYISDYFNIKKYDPYIWIRTHYYKLIEYSRKLFYTNEEVALSMFMEFTYSSPNMTCDILYKPIEYLTMPGCGLLLNADEFNYMISYIYKRGFCDEIFKNHPCLLKRVHGINIDNELVCDIFDVGAKHAELELYDAILRMVNLIR